MSQMLGQRLGGNMRRRTHIAKVLFSFVPCLVIEKSDSIPSNKMMVVVIFVSNIHHSLLGLGHVES